MSTPSACASWERRPAEIRLMPVSYLCASLVGDADQLGISCWRQPEHDPPQADPQLTEWSTSSARSAASTPPTDGLLTLATLRHAHCDPPDLPAAACRRLLRVAAPPYLPKYLQLLLPPRERNHHL
jgi:hypothetical protein